MNLRISFQPRLEIIVVIEQIRIIPHSEGMPDTGSFEVVDFLATTPSHSSYQRTCATVRDTTCEIPMTANDWVTFGWGIGMLILLSGFLHIAFVD